MPDGQNDFDSGYFLARQSIRFLLRPLFCKEVVTQHYYAEPGTRETLVDGSSEAITDLELEFVVPDVEA